jgi:hypothetical protein
VIFRRARRFDELVGRQLDLFAADEAELLGEAEEADEAYGRAAREDAEEAYGDLQLVLETVAERLADVRDTYAGTLDERAATEYVRAFDGEARRRLGRLADGLWEWED